MVGTVAVLSDKLIINATGFDRTELESFIKRAGKLSKPVGLFFLSSLSELQRQLKNMKNERCCTSEEKL